MSATPPPDSEPRTDTLLSVEDLGVDYPARRGSSAHRAVDGVTFGLCRGETLGLVGESGSGKSTTGRAILQMPRPTRGVVTFGDLELTSMDHKALRRVRSGMQLVFQDPVSALNPQRSVSATVAQPLRITGRADPDDTLVDEMLAAVGLDPSVYRDRRPRELSGGQCQRVCIARSLILRPELLICDEVVSGLDVSVQAGILNLLEDMKDAYSLSMIFISHDLSVVRHISDRIAVMYQGRLVEIGPADAVHDQPAHPYTRMLTGSVIPFARGTAIPELPERPRLSGGDHHLIPVDGSPDHFYAA